MAQSRETRGGDGGRGTRHLAAALLGARPRCVGEGRWSSTY